MYHSFLVFLCLYAIYFLSITVFFSYKIRTNHIRGKIVFCRFIHDWTFVLLDLSQECNNFALFLKKFFPKYLQVY